MIIENQAQVTEAVLDEMHRTPDARTRRILESLVRHLHGFVREVQLTENEFDQAIKLVSALGRHTTESHNETRLMAGTLGVSTLVCLLNNGPNNSGADDVNGSAAGSSGGTSGGTSAGSSANLLGPFWRAHSPRTENGGSIVRSATSGPALFFKGWVRDAQGHAIAGAEVDVWHASPVGLYENQDPEQAEMNLRGKFTTDAEGAFSFRSVKPAGYPIPIDGPVGVLLSAQRRHNLRPAHLHCLIYKPGFKVITSQLYVDDDPVLESDVQFGVTRALVRHYARHEQEPAPGPDVTGPWYSLEHVFILEPGEAWLPTPPVSQKAAGQAVNRAPVKQEAPAE